MDFLAKAVKGLNLTRCPNDEERAFKTLCGLELCPDCNFAHLSVCSECLEDYQTQMIFDIMKDIKDMDQG